MSRNRSRPSSAASHSSRSSAVDNELKLECKAAYLCLFDDLREEITSRDDLLSVLQQTGRNPTTKSLSRYWTRDTRSLTFEDFVNICRKEQTTNAEDLIKAFRKIDINGDGYISLDELYKIMTTKGEKMSRDDVREIIDEVDDNKDGRLDYREFCNMIIATTEDCKKLSMKVMEKKDRKKQRKSDERSSSRRESQVKSVSQLSLKSNKTDRDEEVNEVNVDDFDQQPMNNHRGSLSSVRSNRSNVMQSATGISGSRQSLISVGTDYFIYYAFSLISFLFCMIF